MHFIEQPCLCVFVVCMRRSSSCATPLPAAANVCHGAQGVRRWGQRRQCHQPAFVHENKWLVLGVPRHGAICTSVARSMLLRPGAPVARTPSALQRAPSLLRCCGLRAAHAPPACCLHVGRGAADRQLGLPRGVVGGGRHSTGCGCKRLEGACSRLQGCQVAHRANAWVAVSWALRPLMRVCLLFLRRWQSLSWCAVSRAGSGMHAAAAWPPGLATARAEDVRMSRWWLQCGFVTRIFNERATCEPGQQQQSSQRCVGCVRGACVASACWACSKVHGVDCVPLAMQWSCRCSSSSSAASSGVLIVNRCGVQMAARSVVFWRARMLLMPPGCAPGGAQCMAIALCARCAWPAALLHRAG